MMRQLQTILSGPKIPVLSIWVVLLTLLVMPIYPFITTWFGSLFGEPLVWKAAKDIILAVTAAVLLGWAVSDRQRLSAMMRDRLLLALLALVIVMIVKTIFRSDDIADETLAGLVLNGRYLAIFFIGYVALKYGGVNFERLKDAVPALAVTGVFLAIIGMLQVFVLPLDTLESFGYDKETTIAPFIVIDDDPNAPRAFATLRGPNDYGAFLLLTIVAAGVLAFRKLKWAVGAVVMVIALILSSSRSAWLGLAVGATVMASMIYAKGSKFVRRLILAGGATAIVLGVATLIAATTVPALRLAVFHSTPERERLVEGSTEAHWQATGAGVDRVIDDPLGCGLGCSGPASYYSNDPKIAENYFVQIAEEIGIIGLIAWLVVFLMIMKRLWHNRSDELAMVLFISGIGLSVIGVWLHVWADDPISLVWWGLAGLAIGRLSLKQENTKEQA